MIDRAVDANRSVPVSGVLPEIYYRNADMALPWLTRVFGFEAHYIVPEDDGSIHTAQLRLGEAYVMIRTERSGSSSPVTAGTSTHLLMVIVDDVDAHYKRAVAEGAGTDSAPVDQIYGEREYTARDLDGNRWTFAQHIADVDPIAMFGEPSLDLP